MLFFYYQNTPLMVTLMRDGVYITMDILPIIFLVYVLDRRPWFHQSIFRYGIVMVTRFCIPYWNIFCGTFSNFMSFMVMDSGNKAKWKK